MELAELRVPHTDAELAADRLWAAGTTGVEELELESGRLAFRAVLTGDSSDRIGVLARLGDLPDGWSLHWVDVDDAPSDAWREHVVPVEIDGPDGFVLRPAWLPPVGDGRVEIVIEPGASFGLGDHPTTRLCAAATRSLVRAEHRVLDVGCGSGVLGIVAIRFGAARVTAIDVSAAAVDATRSNALLNGVDDAIEVSLTPLSRVRGSFDVVIANILAPTLVALADDLVRVLDDGGVLVVSGVLTESHEHVVAALAPLQVRRRRESGAWCALELSR